MRINQNKNFISDKKFYKKRILDLTKRLFRDELKDEQLINCFHSYLKDCINHLKIADTSDIIQEKYVDSSNIINDILETNVVDNVDNVDNVDSSITLMENDSYANCDHLFWKIEDVKKVNLDSFVINNAVKNNKKILPVKAELNIKTKVHKTKGIAKKKNIGNIKNYEDAKKQEA